MTISTIQIALKTQKEKKLDVLPLKVLVKVDLK